MKQLIILLILAFGITIISNSNEYIEIPSTSIRMRVVADSNSKEDQQNKIIIKSYLEEKIYELIENMDSINDIDKVIEENQNDIDNYIKEKMNEVGIETTFTSSYGLNYFPEKEFKGVKYSAGNYKSYVVTLGEGEGNNWWCVLYPPLCLVDENLEDYEYHYLIKDTIEKYN